MGFKDLKKKSGSRLKDLGDKFENEGGGNKFQDERFWYPEIDKSGNASAVIRFLPEADGEDYPYVMRYQHSFKGPGPEPNKKSNGNWLIELCPTTLGRNCPICENNSKLWQSGVERKVNIARKRKRNVQYISNIYVVKDPSNPDNEGSVFLFRYGKAIRDLIKSAVTPEFEDQEPVDVFDFWEGADFRLRIYRNNQGWVKYDKSTFDAPSALLNGDDDMLEQVYNKMYPLSEFIDEKLFKSEEELKTRLQKVVSGVSSDTSAEDEKSEPASTVNEKVEKGKDDIEPDNSEAETDTESAEEPPFDTDDEPESNSSDSDSDDDDGVDDILDDLMKEDES